MSRTSERIFFYTLSFFAAKHEEILNSVTVKYQEEVANLRLTIEKQSVSVKKTYSREETEARMKLIKRRRRIVQETIRRNS